jgi:hypothetical protein
MYQSQHTSPYINDIFTDTLKHRFHAIATSLQLTTPSDYGDRLAKLVKFVVTDRLADFSDSDQDYGNLDRAVIAILTGAYWHQDLAEMRSRILDLQNYSNVDIPELLLAYAIAYACRSKMQPHNFVSQICQDFTKRRNLSQPFTSQPEFLAQIQKAHKFAEQGASAITFHHTHDPSCAKVAIALYYFLSTPQDWSLVTDRAKIYDLLVAIQAGAITAAYLGKCDSYIQENNIGEHLWQYWAGYFTPVAVFK